MTDGCDEEDWNNVVIWSVLGKVHQFTTVPSQCDILNYPWVWHSVYFVRRPHFEKRPIIFYAITCSGTIEIQHTISYYIKVSYYLLLVSFFFAV